MSYSQLKEIFSQISAIGHALSILGWDEAVMMPEGGADARNDAVASLSVMSHQLLTEEQNKQLIEVAEKEELSSWDAANLKQIKRNYNEAILLPAELIRESSIAGMECEQNWRKLRTENDWETFKPYLEKVVKLSRQKAQILADHYNCSRYDALLDHFEEGLTGEKLEAIFNEIKPFLIEQLVRIQKRSQPVDLKNGPFPIEEQKELSLSIMENMSFDFNHGRLDVSHHPFCGGVSSDVRLTTRYNADDFAEALMGTIHETGHALYEQNLPKEWSTQPIGQSRGMIVHESQSLIMEMQAGRGEEFLSYLYKKIPEGWNIQQNFSEDDFIAAYHKVESGFIRVDADELTYPLHIILRYEIERALIEEEIEVDDIPDLWDDKMMEYLGIDTKGNYENGCMQDPHWPFGGFGYFPTYSLGAFMAAQLFQAAVKEKPQIQTELQAGSFETLNKWLNEKLRSHGRNFTYEEILQQATGQGLSIEPFKEHIKKRYKL
ncbi:MAG: carboxypeptidase M32 [Lentisphaeria bacterium]|nr:carboxypeptidase M32 [Lentisphaeria bacterium]